MTSLKGTDATPLTLKPALKTPALTLAPPIAALLTPSLLRHRQAMVVEDVALAIAEPSAPLESPELTGTTVLQEKREHPDRTALPPNQSASLPLVRNCADVNPDLPEILDPLEVKAPLVDPVMLEPREKMVTVEPVKPDHRDLRDQPDTQDPKARKEMTVVSLLVLPDLQVDPDPPGMMVDPETLEIPDLLVTQEMTEPQEVPEIKDPTEAMGTAEKTATPALADLLAHLALVLLAHPQGQLPDIKFL